MKPSPRDRAEGRISRRGDRAPDRRRLRLAQAGLPDILAQLAAELPPGQVDALKEAWSRSPGMMCTYNAYLEIVPDLKDVQKNVIFDRMKLAREDAMLTDADREIVAIFKRHKVKVEAYVGTLE